MAFLLVIHPGAMIVAHCQGIITMSGAIGKSAHVVTAN